MEAEKHYKDVTFDCQIGDKKLARQRTWKKLLKQLLEEVEGKWNLFCHNNPSPYKTPEGKTPEQLDLEWRIFSAKAVNAFQKYVSLLTVTDFRKNQIEDHKFSKTISASIILSKFINYFNQITKLNSIIEAHPDHSTCLDFIPDLLKLRLGDLQLEVLKVIDPIDSDFNASKNKASKKRKADTQPSTEEIMEELQTPVAAEPVEAPQTN